MSTQRLCLTFVWLFFADGTSHDMVRNTTHLSYCSHIRIRRPTAVSSGKQRRDEIVHRTDISTQYGQKERTINKCSMTHIYHCLQPSATICCNHLQPSSTLHAPAPLYAPAPLHASETLLHPSAVMCGTTWSLGTFHVHAT